MRRSMLKPRWLALHALTVLVAAAFLVLGWWQLGRGEAGNVRSYAYALEWPMFALFVVFMWWHVVRDSQRPPTGAGTAPDGPGPRPGPDVEPVLPRVLARRERPAPALGEEEPDERLVAYNRYLADLHARDEQRTR